MLSKKYISLWFNSLDGVPSSCILVTGFKCHEGAKFKFEVAIFASQGRILTPAPPFPIFTQIEAVLNRMKLSFNAVSIQSSEL